MAEELFIVQDHRDSVKYAISLMRLNREQVGFLPTMALEDLEAKGGLTVGLLNKEICGYIAFEPPRPLTDCRFLQICLPMDVRRRYYGAKIVVSVEDRVKKAGGLGIWFKVAWDIEANDFWQSIGYYCSGIVHGGYKRNRILNVYRKDFTAPLLTTTVEPRKGQKDVRRYNKMRTTGKLLLPFGYKQSELIEW